MKKIMFNDRYGLTEAVLDRRKTMTRRIVPKQYDVEWDEYTKTLFVDTEYSRRPNGWVDIREVLGYKVGEVIAIAQSYRDIAQGGFPIDSRYDVFRTANWGNGEDGELKSSAGWSNKMFVHAALMPHHIKITNVRAERLQDISDEDCFREGINASNSHEIGYGIPWVYKFANSKRAYYTPREAFAALIDNFSGNGTWQSNPWVFAYEFELVD